MKKIEFTTSKGEFVVVDIPAYVVEFTANKSTFKIGEIRCKLICKLSEATEEQAKGVVDEKEMFSYGSEKKIVTVYEDYIDKILVHSNPLHSLHSLLTSKGIDINNGNWYLFKKI